MFNKLKIHSLEYVESKKCRNANVELKKQGNVFGKIQNCTIIANIIVVGIHFVMLYYDFADAQPVLLPRG